MVKLAATENTVRLLAKKNKSYASVLESNGLGDVMRRSSSETCLSALQGGHMTRRASAGNLDLLAGGDHSANGWYCRLCLKEYIIIVIFTLLAIFHGLWTFSVN